MTTTSATVVPQCAICNGIRLSVSCVSVILSASTSLCNDPIMDFHSHGISKIDVSQKNGFVFLFGTLSKGASLRKVLFIWLMFVLIWFICHSYAMGLSLIQVV